MNTAESMMIIIFGATGDLTKRKLIPSLYHMIGRNQLSGNSPIVCVGRRPYSKEEFVETLQLENFVESADATLVAQLFSQLEYLQADLSEISPEEFAGKIEEVRTKYSCSHNKLIYFALATTLFQAAVALLRPLLADRG